MDELLKDLYENDLITVEQAKSLKYASPGERMNLAREMYDSGELDASVAKQLKVIVEDVDSTAVQDVLQTPGLPEEQKGPEDPLKLAQAYAREMNIPLEQAVQEVATWPRRTHSFLKGESSHVLPVLGDLGSRPGSVLNAALFGQDDFLGDMGRVDPNPMTAEGEERGFMSMLASSVLKDPTLPITPLTGGGALKMASKIPALMTGTRAANIGRQALAGGAASIGETFLEQQTRPEGFDKLSLGDYATVGALGSGMGGALGGFQKPSKVATPGQQQKAFLKETKKIKEAGKIGGVNVEDVNPLYRQDFFTELTDLDIPYQDYAKTAQAKMNPNLKAGAPRAKSSLEFAVDKVAAPAFEAYKKATQKVGKEIGEVREKLLPKIQPIPKENFVEMVSDGMTDDVTKLVREVIDGQEFIYPVNTINGKRLPLDEDTQKIVKALGALDDNVDGGDLRFFQKKINKMIPVDPVSSQKIISPETASLIGVEKMTREAIDTGVESVAGKDVAQYFRKIRSEYGPMRDNVKEIGRQLGKSIDFSPSGLGENIGEVAEKGFKKGEGAIARILQSKQSQGAKFLWDEVKNVTGYNVPKSAAYALQAAEEAGDVTSRSLLDQIGGLQKSIPKDMSDRSVWETAGKLGKKAIGAGKEFVSPSAGRGVRAAAAAVPRPTAATSIPKFDLGMFTGRGIVDQPIAENAIFPYMLGEETNETY